MSTRDERLLDILADVLEAPEDRRAALLNEACAGDAALRAEAERLVALSGKAKGFLNTPAVAPGVASPPPEHPPQIGRYRIVRLIGEGGMGCVYEAEQDWPHRQVALKVIRPGMVGERAMRRFAYEAELLGRLQHPGIAQIYEADVAHAGRGPQPYFAMELVRGMPVTEYAKRHKLDLRRRLELLARVCDAVHYAHQRSVIHRDLKPGNVLVDDQGNPKIVDFGVARLSEEGAEAATAHTRTGELLGTLNYMSPEQAGSDPAQVDTRSDVYALGVIGYELLSGRRPYDLTRLALLEAVRAIREDEPSRLSEIDRSLRGDVETIVGKAMDKARDRRYASAAELAADLRRYLNDEPIAARAPGRWYQVSKFARRNRVLVSAAAAVFVALSLGIVGTTWQLRRARASEARSIELAASELAQRQRAESAYADLLIPQGSMYLASGRYGEAKRTYTKAYELLTRMKRPLFPAELGLQRAEVLEGSPVMTFSGHSGPVTAIDSSPDGRLILSGGEDGAVRLWDGVLGRELMSLGNQGSAVSCVALSGDGSAAAVGTAGGAVTLFDTKTNSRSELGDRAAGILSICFAEGETGLVWIDGRGVLSRWHKAQTRVTSEALSPENPAIGIAAFSSNGRRVITGSNEAGRVTVWEVSNRKQVRSFDVLGNVSAVALSSDGLLGAVGVEKIVHVWDIVRGKVWDSRAGHVQRVTCVSFSPDGTSLMSGGEDQTLRLWEDVHLAFGEPNRTFSGPTSRVTSIAYRNERVAISAAADGSLTLWAAPTSTEVRTLAYVSWGASGVFSPDGKTALLCDGGSDMSLVDLATGQELVAFAGGGGSIYHVAISADGKLALSGGENGEVKVWDVASGRELRAFQGHRLDVTAVAISPGGDRAASGDQEGTAFLWDPRSGKPIVAVAGKGRYKNALAFSGDGSRLVAAESDNTLRILDAHSGGLIQVLRGHSGTILGVGFLPDGRGVISGSDDGTIRLWDLSTTDSRIVAGIARETDERIRFSPDCRVAFTLEYPDGCVYDLDQSREVFRGSDLTILAYSPANNSILVRVGSDRVEVRDLSRAARKADLRQRAAAAGAELRRTARTGAALESLGEWYAFCGLPGFAAECWKRARECGTAVAPVDLARARWLLGDDDGAQAAFREAMDAAPNDGELRYLSLCLSGLKGDQIEEARRASVSAARQQIRRRIEHETQQIGVPREKNRAYASRGLLHARLGDFRSAVADLANVEVDGHSYLRASLLLLTGDTEGCRRLCSRRLDFAEAQRYLIAERDLDPLLLMVPDDTLHVRAIKLIEVTTDFTESVTIGLGGQSYLMRGIAEYRAGRFEAAIDWLGRTSQWKDSVVLQATSALFSSMAHYRLGHEAEAKAVMARASRLIEEQVPAQGVDDLGGEVGIRAWAVCRLAQAEAKGLVTAGAAKSN